MGLQCVGYCMEIDVTFVFILYVAEEARLKVQYAVTGEQMKAVKLKKLLVMQRLRDAAVVDGAATAASGGECRRCHLLTAQVEALNRRLATIRPQAAAVPQPRRAPQRRRANEDVEPSSDDSSIILVGEGAP